MRQRAMIALAPSCRPAVLLADEPTTALDVTVQIQIIVLLRQLQQELGMAVVFVTHDVGVAAEVADRISCRGREGTALLATSRLPGSAISNSARRLVRGYRRGFRASEATPRTDGR
jgi:ABC-type microcin C transport system duplicated ATPase subunit YejF